MTATTVSAAPDGGPSGLAYSQLRRSPGSSAGAARPISGAFSLDIAKIEGQVDRQSGRSALMSRLVNHDNLDDILNGDPVVLPPTGVYCVHMDDYCNNTTTRRGRVPVFRDVPPSINFHHEWR